jgi:hypothetical protein
MWNSWNMSIYNAEIPVFKLITEKTQLSILQLKTANAVYKLKTYDFKDI